MHGALTRGWATQIMVRGTRIKGHGHVAVMVGRRTEHDHGRWSSIPILVGSHETTLLLSSWDKFIFGLIYVMPYGPSRCAWILMTMYRGSRRF